MRTQDIPSFALREQDAMAMAAPAGDMGAAPPVPGKTTNDEHIDRTAWQMGMDPEEFKAGLEGGTMTFYRPYDFSDQWGFHVAGPVEGQVEEQEDETWKVTFMLEGLPQNRFYLPYGEGEQPTQYMGPHPDKTEVLTISDLQNQLAAPLDPEVTTRGNEPPERNPMEDPGMVDSGAPSGGPSDTGGNGLTPTG